MSVVYWEAKRDVVVEREGKLWLARGEVERRWFCVDEREMR